MSIIKNIRKKSGFTQMELSEKSGLSLRTIQRFESKNKEPKGHTLTVLSEVFDMEPATLQDKFKNNSLLCTLKLGRGLSIKIVFRTVYNSMIVL